ncbi:hypothetical protein FRX31_002225 [Thalictrum thalictroides]|uniref:Defensin-like protein n=1 Tax=Thalictrum thalictroides TaxID=46969 RepID=A0A7J6XGH6_THATH|nr:hypothetical protein FRX31_002225 [Thalictrum thalictroides]
MANFCYARIFFIVLIALSVLAGVPQANAQKQCEATLNDKCYLPTCGQECYQKYNGRGFCTDRGFGKVSECKCNYIGNC